MSATRDEWPATATPTFFAPIVPRVVSTPTMRAARIADEAGQFAILDDVDAAIGRAARITPDHCVMPRGTAAALQQPAHDRKARMIDN